MPVGWAMKSAAEDRTGVLVQSALTGKEPRSGRARLVRKIKGNKAHSARPTQRGG
jgi:hypothetical protein